MSLTAAIAANVYARAGIAPLDLPGPVLLAEALLGGDAIFFVGPERTARPLTVGGVRLVFSVTRWELHIARALGLEDGNLEIATAIAQWYLHVEPTEGCRAADLGRHLLLPSAVLAHLLDDQRLDREQIARQMKMPEVAVAERMCEFRALRGAVRKPSLRLIQGGRGR